MRSAVYLYLKKWQACCMLRILLIALGGAVGSVLRYWLSTSVYAVVGRDFPYGTLAVNVVGSFLMGYLAMFFLERFVEVAGEMRSLLLIGLLGGFTTFSAFSIETLALFENGEVLRAGLNIALSIILCLTAVWAGAKLGRV
jgi:CrcB protein